MNLNSLKTTSFLLLFILLASACNSFQEKESINPKLDKLKLQPGFKAEHLFSPSENEMGSWVSMTFDNKGRLITSDQYGTLYRMEIPPIGSDSLKPVIEKLMIQTEESVADSVIQMGFAQGLLWAFNSLYVMVNHRSNDEFEMDSGLYRLQDTDNNDQFDKITLLKSLKGAGEHGPHSIVLSPDGNSLYVISGNHTDAPEMDSYRNPNVWQNDNLFPLFKDPRGHANSRGAPGGWIAHIDSLGNHWELVSSGFRNAFDLTFNDAGDMFTFDSDMEWDFGMPWYRPTRICHVTSGSEFGWRTGNGKWSAAYPDNLPAVLNIGQGSPTGVMHGKSADFPSSYKEAVFAFDWSFGIVYAVHLKPEGSSYTAVKEEFLSGIPLPLTDGVIGPDGAMYFMTGGRRLNSDLYRVYYDANDSDNDSHKVVEQTEENKIRRQLEEYHGAPQDGAVDFAWSYLNNNDRFIRFAARVAIEHQPIKNWQERVYQEKDAVSLTQGIIALARHADKSQRDRMLNALVQVDYESLSASQQVDILRAFELSLSRFGMPGTVIKNKVTAYLSPHYPAQNDVLNQLLSKTLCYLEAPKVIEKTLTLLETKVETDASGMTNTATDASDLILRNLQYGLDIAHTLSNMPPAQHTYYALALSGIKSGWTPELRERYFRWFYRAFGYDAGRSYIGFINNARKSALTHVPENRFDYYNEISGDTLVTSKGTELANIFKPKGPGKRWAIDDIKPLLEGGLHNRNFVQGKNMFNATVCLSCHTMRGSGGVSGPDLTQLGTRFSAEDMMIAMIDPSQAVSDQYASDILHLKNGQTVVGRIIDEDEQNYKISQNPFSPDVLREVPVDQVTDRKLSTVSAMPPGMINRLNEEELKDLLAYLISGGNPEHAVYE